MERKFEREYRREWEQEKKCLEWEKIRERSVREEDNKRRYLKKSSSRIRSFMVRTGY